MGGFARRKRHGSRESWAILSGLAFLSACSGMISPTPDESRDAGSDASVTPPAQQEAGNGSATPIDASAVGEASVGGRSLDGGPGGSAWDSGPITRDADADADAHDAHAGDADASDADASDAEGGPLDATSSGGGFGCAADGGSTLPVSFTNDIIPLFQLSCTLSSVCHGQIGNPAEEDLYLGKNAGGTDASMVYAGIVGVHSREDPEMNLITPGDVAASFLWLKSNVDDLGNFVDLMSSDLLDECAPAAASSNACSNCGSPTFCGAGMPYLSIPLESSQLCLLKAWIEQGAQNN
jgi:hypothetical protein